MIATIAINLIGRDQTRILSRCVKEYNEHERGWRNLRQKCRLVNRILFTKNIEVMLSGSLSPKGEMRSTKLIVVYIGLNSAHHLFETTVTSLLRGGGREGAER